MKLTAYRVKIYVASAICFVLIGLALSEQIKSDAMVAIFVCSIFPISYLTYFARCEFCHASLWLQSVNARSIGIEIMDKCGECENKFPEFDFKVAIGAVLKKFRR
jgi:hypothetical protein